MLFSCIKYLKTRFNRSCMCQVVLEFHPIKKRWMDEWLSTRTKRLEKLQSALLIYKFNDP